MAAKAITPSYESKLGALLSSATALVAPRFSARKANEWSDFSPLMARAFDAPGATRAGVRPSETLASVIQQKATEAMDWAREAYQRLETLIRGDFSPRSPAEARKYFRDAETSIERRSTGDGNSTNYLVDNLTGNSTPATRVSPKLTDKFIDKTLGRDSRRDKALGLETARAHSYRDALERAGNLRVEISEGKPPFSDWQDVQFSLSNVLTAKDNPRDLPFGYAITGDGEKQRGFVGLEAGRCSPDPLQTLENMRKAANKLGVDIPSGPMNDEIKNKLKRTFIVDDHLANNTPFLVRDKNLVRASQIHASLGAVQLAASFKAEAERLQRQGSLKLREAVNKDERKAASNMIEKSVQADKMADFKVSAASVAGSTETGQVFNLSAIREARQRKSVQEQENNASIGKGFGGLEEESGGLSPKNVLIRYENGQPQMYVVRQSGEDRALFDGKNERPLMEVAKISDLPPGAYPVEDEMQMPNGKMVVGPGGPPTHVGARPVEDDFTPEPAQNNAMDSENDGGMKFGG